MKPLLSAVTLAAVVGVSSYASAAPQPFKGSDTLFGVVNDAITQLGLDASLQYVGGGSGQGETALLAGTQGIAPMSRAIADAAIAEAAARGVTITQNVIGLDGISIFVKFDTGVDRISIPVLRSIYGGEDGTGSPEACAAPGRVTRFEQIPNGSTAVGTIRAIRRNDDSGTTDAFKSLVGVKKFCADVVVKATTEEIKAETSSDPLALGYAGESAEAVGRNKPLGVAKGTTGPSYRRTPVTVRDLSYPLARRLYVNVATSAARPLTTSEQALLDNLLDRSFADPILTSNQFVTCNAAGCP